jgi:F-box/leucine-rich repeat protein 2/20
MHRTCLSLARNGRKLQKLDLTSCSNITDESLKALGEGCPMLNHINISWCDNITEKGEYIISTKMYPSSFQCFNFFHYILGIGSLARGCTKLRTFIVKSRSFIDNESVFHLANHCPILEAVNFNGAIVSRCSSKPLILRLVIHFILFRP